MASRKTRSWLKIGACALGVVVLYDLYKAHTGGPAPTTSASRIKA